MEHTAPVSLWDTLPDECKSMILGRLSIEEAAQLAGVCNFLSTYHTFVSEMVSVKNDLYTS